MESYDAVRRLTVGIAALVLVVGAVAGPSTRKTTVTFNQSVRVPGVVLPPGTYSFDAPSVTNRAIVRITDESGKFVTQVRGVTEPVQKPNHDIITFGANECGPKAIKLWFYPASGTAVRFVYSHKEATLIAASCNEPVPETRDDASGSPSQESKVYLMTPNGKEQEYKSEALSPSDQLDKNGFDADIKQQQ